MMPLPLTVETVGEISGTTRYTSVHAGRWSGENPVELAALDAEGVFRVFNAERPTLIPSKSDEAPMDALAPSLMKYGDWTFSYMTRTERWTGATVCRWASMAHIGAMWTEMALTK